MSSNRLSTSDNAEKVNDLTLEKVFGFTIANNASVTLDPISGVVAYPAGCVVVGYSPKKSKQFFIHNTVKSPITAVAFSRDGKLLATGESGKLPRVRIWDVETRSQMVEFSGHNYRVGAVMFSPNNRYLVSIGSQEDMTINVWETNTNLKMATSRVTSKINAVAFSETGHFFVTVGVRHVRFWYLDNAQTKTKTTMVLSGRNAILGDFMNNTFNDVGCCSLTMPASDTSSNTGNINCQQSYTYVISHAGQLMQFSEQRYLDKWVELQTPKATCLSVSTQYIMAGCSRGVILIFDTVSLTHLATLSKPHCMGVDIQTGKLNDGLLFDPLRYPDVIAGKYDHIRARVTCFYNDHSLYTWDISDIHNCIKVLSQLFHSGGIWSVEPTSVTQSDNGSIFDKCSFMTCSDDQTIRFWSLHDCPSLYNQSHTTKSSSNWCNNLSKELLKIIYTDPNLKCLTETDRLLVKNNPSNSDSIAVLKHGIRSIKISPNRLHLASADREGNLRFFSLVDFTEFHSIIAHNGEILCIDYFQSPSAPDLLLFCSSSRDRLIRVMDPSQLYKCIQTIDDHSGAIFAVKLVETPSDQEIRLVSCGMDKSLLFRILQPDESCQTAQFFLNQHLVGKQSQYDMVIAPNNRYAAVACQDRQVRIYNLVSGKQRKSYRGGISDDGNLLKCAIDPSGTYLATSGSDRYLHILNFTTGEILASVTGHSEMALGLCFLSDLKHVVSVSADSCVFVWRLPIEMTLTMYRRQKELGSLNNITDYEFAKEAHLLEHEGSVALSEISGHTTSQSSNTAICATVSSDNTMTASPSTFRFSVSALPSWAQKKFSRRDSVTFVQVNMLTDFCASMSTVLEQKEENLFFNGTPHPDAVGGRRMSFIATEKVIRDDDSDNVDEDDSEWFALRKEPCERSLDLESVIKSLNTHDEESEDDDLMIKKPQIQSALAESPRLGSEHCKYVIKRNDDAIKENNNRAVSATCMLASCTDEKTCDYSNEDNLLNIVPGSCTSVGNGNFSFDDIVNTGDSTSLVERIRNSLNSGNFSKTSQVATFVNSPGKMDSTLIDKCSQRTMESRARKFNAQIQKKCTPIKSRSEVNVSQIGTGLTMSESNVKSIKNNQSSEKVNAAKSRDLKSNENKATISRLSERRAFNKSLSINCASKTEDCTEPRQRSDTPTLSAKSVTSINSVSDLSIKTPRPKWSDCKKSKIIRKTCPVNVHDIKYIRTTHTSVPDDVMVNEPSYNNGHAASGKVISLNENVYAKSISLNLVIGNDKEHVIDGLGDISRPTSEPNADTLDEMLNFLASQNQINPQDSFNAISQAIKTVDLEEPDQCTDDWINEQCNDKSVEFLSSMTMKILHRLIDNSNLNSPTQKEVFTRLMFEIEKVYFSLRSTLDLNVRYMDTDATADLIRDIGERILNEVKQRLPEPL